VVTRTSGSEERAGETCRWKRRRRAPARPYYLKAGLGTEKACLMVLIGADTEGKKHLIALREGYRESTDSWSALLRDGRQRGLNEPACWIADGALGLWAAIDAQSPSRRSSVARTTRR
jgi:transposase-like protein